MKKFYINICVREGDESVCFPTYTDSFISIFSRDMESARNAADLIFESYEVDNSKWISLNSISVIDEEEFECTRKGECK